MTSPEDLLAGVQDVLALFSDSDSKEEDKTGRFCVLAPRTTTGKSALSSAEMVAAGAADGALKTAKYMQAGQCQVSTSCTERSFRGHALYEPGPDAAHSSSNFGALSAEQSKHICSRWRAWGKERSSPTTLSSYQASRAIRLETLARAPFQVGSHTRYLESPW
eukprot:IDg14092t1